MRSIDHHVKEEGWTMRVDDDSVLLHRHVHGRDRRAKLVREGGSSVTVDVMWAYTCRVKHQYQLLISHSVAKGRQGLTRRPHAEQI